MNWSQRRLILQKSVHFDSVLLVFPESSRGRYVGALLDVAVPSNIVLRFGFATTAATHRVKQFSNRARRTQPFERADHTVKVHNFAHT